MIPQWLNQLLFVLLFPFSLGYALVMGIRNYLYKIGFLQSVRFTVPVISVGNLSVGGSGKTPAVAYIAKLLQEQYKLAKISRGYGRKSVGYKEVEINSPVEECGDEALMIKRMLPAMQVAVCENRLLAIPELLGAKPDTDLVLLDDAFQHRSVRAGLNILLTEYSKPFTRDYILPAGRLREARKAYLRADIIVVTKCPDALTNEQREALRSEIKPATYQHLYFSKLAYGKAYSVFGEKELLNENKQQAVILLSGIARSDYFENYTRSRYNVLHHLSYNDHHWYDRYDLESIRNAYKNAQHVHPVILTTEKDAARLSMHLGFFEQNRLPLYCQPVELQFFETDKAAFEKDIYDYMNYSLKENATAHND